MRRQIGAETEVIAIVLIEHFGDIVACEPVIRHLRASNPTSHLVWIVRGVYVDLVAAHPQLNATVTVTCLTEALRIAQHNIFTRVLNLHVNYRRCNWFYNVYSRLDGDPSITVDNYYDFGSLLPAFCRAAGLPALHDSPELNVKCNSLPDCLRVPYLVIHARTNEEDRNWTDENWTELVRTIHAHSPVLIVEVGLARVVNEPYVIDLCGQLTLSAVAEVIRNSDCFIGVDSGPAHLANASQRPSVIMLGRYRKWSRYFPFTGFLRAHADEMVIQWSGRCAEIPVAVCFDRLREVCPKLFYAIADSGEQMANEA